MKKNKNAEKEVNKMKKLIAVGIAVLLVLGVSSLGHADPMSTSKSLVAHLPVSSAFGFQVWDTELDQYLNAVIPGTGETASVHIAATSNHSIPYTISANSAGLVGENQGTPDTLPVVMSTYDGGAGLNGTIVTDLTLTGSDQAIYTAGAGDYPCSGLEIGCIFAVNTTVTTKEDLYTGTIVMTMTE